MLDGRARRLHSEASQLHGSKLTHLMNRSFYLAIYSGETVLLQPVLQEIEDLRQELAAATVELTIQQDISSMKEKLNVLLREGQFHQLWTGNFISFEFMRG